ncbi:MAG: hypothetical protein JW855_03245 [Gammaproteobacteria bacterium]|nr:hypothetical protein [Gammaproteobacteria bacterium]
MFWIRDTLETLFMIGLFTNAALYIPQIIALVQSKNSENLSLITFGGITFSQLFVVLHSMLDRDILLLIGANATLLTCGTVTFLIIYYRYRIKRKMALVKN